MPIYSYECKNCGKVFEHMTGVVMDEAPLGCPKCKAREVNRKYSSFNVGNAKVTQREDSCSQCCHREKCR